MTKDRKPKGVSIKGANNPRKAVTEGVVVKSGANPENPSKDHGVVIRSGRR